MAHTRQSKPDSGLGLQVKVLETVFIVPFCLRAELDAISHKVFIQPSRNMVRIHFMVEMFRWTGHAPWEIGFPFSGSLASTKSG